MFFLAGGFGAAVAFFLGLVFATTLLRVLVLGVLGALVSSGYHAALAADSLDPVLAQLMHAAGDANALGWLAGTLLVARLRCLEWLDARLGIRAPAGMAKDQAGNPRSDAARSRRLRAVADRADPAQRLSHHPRPRGFAAARRSNLQEAA